MASVAYRAHWGEAKSMSGRRAAWTALLEGLRAHERAVELGASDPWALVSAPGGRVEAGGARQLCET